MTIHMHQYVYGAGVSQGSSQGPVAHQEGDWMKREEGEEEGEEGEAI